MVRNRLHSYFVFFLSICILIFTLILVQPATSLQSASPSRGYDTGDIELCTANCGFEYGSIRGWGSRDGRLYVNTENVRSGRYAVYGTTAERATLYRRLTLSRFTVIPMQGTGRYRLKAMSIRAVPNRCNSESSSTLVRAACSQAGSPDGLAKRMIGNRSVIPWQSHQVPVQCTCYSS